MSSGVPDPRIDIYLTKMDIEEYWPLWRKQYVMQIADAFLFSPKYRLVILSPEANADGQLQLHVSVKRFGKGWNIKTSVMEGDEELEAATTYSRSSKRKAVLKKFRESLYQLVMGKKRTEEKRVYLVQMEKKALKKALRIPARPKPLTDEEKEKLKLLAEKQPEPDTTQVDESTEGQPVETVAKKEDPNAKKDLVAQGKDTKKEEVDEGPSIFSYFPRVFVKASMVIGDPVTGWMPGKQGTQTTELALGLNKTNWGTSFTYATRSFILQTIAEVQASQEITEFRLNQEILGFNLFTSPKDRLHTKDKDSWYLGLCLGIGTMVFGGEDIPSDIVLEVPFRSYGVFLNILGVANLEVNYTSFTEEPSSRLFISDQYPATVLRFSIGYPL